LAQPTPTKPITYADAGVDIARANRTKQRIKYLAHKTFTKGVLSEIGGFGGLFEVDRKRFRDPVLVSSVDGVGTKLKVAFEMNLHSTVGGDLVNHCVNDIAVQGATPLFFMDYLAAGKLEPEIAESVVEGISEACKHNGCALIGGETAEMPGFYPPGEYDLAGFIVGVVDKDRIITGEKVAVGDVLIGLPSNGLHTNGYSLARKLMFTVARYSPDTYVNELHRRRHHREPAARPAQGHGGGGRARHLDRTVDLPAHAEDRERSRRRHDAHLQHGHRDGAGRAGQEVQEGADDPGARGREGLHHRAHRQGRAQGDVRVSVPPAGVPLKNPCSRASTR